MSLSDFSDSNIFNDTEHHAASVRQLKFLLLHFGFRFIEFLHENC